MTATPEIETTRLVLKAVQIQDAPDIYNYARNPNVLRFTMGTTPFEFAETEAFVRGLVNKPDGAFAWAIRQKTTSSIIGVVEFGLRGRSTASVDYALSEAHWGQGIAAEAVRALLDWAYQSLPVFDRVQTCAMTANPASTRVQQKCGMKLLRCEDQNWAKFDQPVEVAVCAVTREEWQAAKKSIETTS